MAIPAPDFNLEGLEGQELRDRIKEILRDGVAEGDSTTMDLLEDHLLEEELKLDPCYEDENTRKAIDLFGRDEWELGIRPTIIESAGCIGSSEQFKMPRQKSTFIKILLKLGLAKEVRND